jgi:6-phosphogluconolactonase
MGNIIYRKITSTEPIVDYLIGVLTEKLIDNKKVLWLVPGGSAIKVATAVAQSLSIENLTHLRVSLTDERYGPVGHADSNWPQLEAAGFKLDGATMQPVLIGEDLQQTTRSFARTLAADLASVDCSLALIGMGPDGHICGIKPGSVAVASQQLAASYKSDDFIRITTTSKLLEKLDEAVVYAVGEAKWPQLDTLDKEVDPKTQPAQLLKRVKSVIIFNDHKGATE